MSMEKGVYFNLLNVKSVYFRRSLKRVWGGAQIYSIYTDRAVKL